MDKKLQDKSSNFFKKEGFYVVLFVCLCVVAVVAAFSAKNAMVSKEKQEQVSQAASEDKQVAEQSEEATKSVDQKKTVDNATEVKNNNQNNAAVAEKDGDKSAQVANTSNGKFVNPVDGTLARTYSAIPEYVEGLNKAVTHFAIHVKADAGATVKSAQEGAVTKVYVNNEENKDLVDSEYKNFGNYVEITHQNGVVTRYANLENISVKKDQKVKQGDAIGKIGNSSITYSSEKYGSHLCFAVYKNGEEQDPLKYVSYKPATEK